MAKMLKQILPLGLCFLLVLQLTACSSQTTSNIEDNNGRLKIITTIFAAYDFARQTAGTRADVTLLLKPGTESHSYEPSPKDIIAIHNCDLFICSGGENDAWVDTLFESIDNPHMEIIHMVDCTDALEEEDIEGMQSEEGFLANLIQDGEAEETVEWDEHVWMNPANASLIVKKIAEVLQKIDPANYTYYAQAADSYCATLTLLDSEIQAVVSSSPRKELIFADRFPARYFTEQYNLQYYAAFPGCSENTEASASTVSFLINKVREDNIPAVFKIELSNGKLADTVAEETNTQVLTFYTGHNVSADDFNNGFTYIDMMHRNIDALKIALN